MRITVEACTGTDEHVGSDAATGSDMSAWPDPAVLTQRRGRIDTGIRIDQCVTDKSKQAQLAIELESCVVHRASIDGDENPQGRRVEPAQSLFRTLLNLVGTFKTDHMPCTCRINALSRSGEIIKHVTATDHAEGIVHTAPISWW